MEQSEKVKRVTLAAVTTALIGAVLSMCVGLLLAANQYRMALKRDETARLVRQINLLILLRDELARIQAGIDRGTFQVTVDGGVLQSEGYEWPAPLWSNLKWNAEVLGIDPSLVQLLANVYVEVDHAENLRKNVASSVSNPLTSYMEKWARAMGAPEKDLKKMHAPDPQLAINMKAYADVQARIRQALPPTLTALDLKINDLRTRIEKP